MVESICVFCGSASGASEEYLAAARTFATEAAHRGIREISHRGLTELRVVESMHERKATMAELADAFVALPGGLGTLEELFEVWTWGQLGLHTKPYGVLNVRDYYTPLIRFLDHARDEGCVRPAQRSMLLVDTDSRSLIERLSSIERQ